MAKTHKLDVSKATSIDELKAILDSQNLEISEDNPHFKNLVNKGLVKLPKKEEPKK